MIDPELLPAVALIDTGVLIRALGERPNDPDTPECRAFVEAMVRHRREVLIAAPTLSEVLRFKRGQPAPTLEGIIVAAFDADAAIILGQKFPEDMLLEWQKKTQNPLAYYKYDALIVACAMKWQADCIVALDKDIHRLAKQQNLRVERPSAFRTRQGHLALVSPSGPIAAPTSSNVALHGSDPKDSKS